MTPTRRGFLIGLGGLLAAPAIVRAASLMPVSRWSATPWQTIEAVEAGVYRRYSGYDILNISAADVYGLRPYPFRTECLIYAAGVSA